MPSMTMSEFFQALTLWFVAMIFLQTESGSSGPVESVIAFAAIALIYVVPLYVFITLGMDFLSE